MNDDRAQLYITSEGKVLHVKDPVMDPNQADMSHFSRFISPESQGDSKQSVMKIRPGYWQVVSVAVDCVEGKFSVYIDGNLVEDPTKSKDAISSYGSRYFNPLFTDCSLAITNCLTLFASSTQVEMQGASLKQVHLYTKVLSSKEICNLTTQIRPEGASWPCMACDTKNQSKDVSCIQCGDLRNKQKKKSDKRFVVTCECGVICDKRTSSQCMNCGDELTTRKSRVRPYVDRGGRRGRRGRGRRRRYF